MNADAFRHFYNYHFSENRKIWDLYISELPQDKFTQNLDYSIGSVRNHVVHLMNVDEAWFSGLRGAEGPAWRNPVHFHDRGKIRAEWDQVEEQVRAYLDDLRDDMLFSKPFTDEEDKDLILWQVLLHVANHGTDHRAQMLRMLHDLGVKTGPQDYVFYIYDKQ